MNEVNEEQEYLKKNGRLSVGVPNDQKEADETKKAIKDFWNNRGDVVEVSATLTLLENWQRSVSLRFDIYKK